MKNKNILTFIVSFCTFLVLIITITSIVYIANYSHKNLDFKNRYDWIVQPLAVLIYFGIPGIAALLFKKFRFISKGILLGYIVLIIFIFILIPAFTFIKVTTFK